MRNSLNQKFPESEIPRIRNSLNQKFPESEIHIGYDKFPEWEIPWMINFSCREFFPTGNFSSHLWISPILYEFIIQGISLPSGSGKFSSIRGLQGRREFLLPSMNFSSIRVREFLLQGISHPLRAGNFSFREFIIQWISHSGNFSSHLGREFLI